MAVDWIQEIETSREGSDTLGAGSTAILKWAVYGTDDITTMRTAVWALVPPEVSDGRDRPLEFRTLERRQLGPKYWEWTANYADPERAEEKTLNPGDIEWTADTTGATQRIYVSRGTKRYAPAGQTAPDFKGAIGCKSDRDIEGCDIVIPACKVTAHYKFPYGRHTLAIIRDFYALTGTVCVDDFLDFAAGEALFLGVSLKLSKKTGTEAAFNFAVSYNEEGLNIADIKNIAKPGHDYLWVRFQDNTDAGRKTRRPEAAYVERVYRQVAWDALDFIRASN